MSYKKVLFLQPRQYFERLGVVFDTLPFDYEFGMPSFGIITGKYKEYDAAVTCIDHSQYTRFICQEFKRSGVKVILMMDGVFEWANATNNPYLEKLAIKLLSPVCYDSVLTVDRALMDILKKEGVESDQYTKRVCEASLNNRQRFLITTANTPYFDLSEYSFLVSAIKEISDCLEENSIEFDYRIFDERLIKDLAIEDSRNKVSGTIENVGSKYAGVFTTPSSIVISLMEIKIPVCIIDYRDGPLFVQSGWRKTPGSNTDKILKSMLAKDKDRMGYQSSQLADKSTNEALRLTIDRYFRPFDPAVDYSQVNKDPFVISFEFYARKCIVFLRDNFKGFTQRIIVKVKNDKH